MKVSHTRACHIFKPYNCATGVPSNITGDGIATNGPENDGQ